MNVYLPNLRLPSGYQEVEWIGSSGTQWIDTGVIPTSNTKSQMKVSFTAYTGDVVYGYFKGDDNNDYRFFNAYARLNHDLFDLGRTTFDFSNQRITGNVGYFQLNTIYELELGNYYLKNMETGTNLVSGSAISSFTGTRTITLNNYNNTYFSKNKWYYVKIYNGSTLVRDFVPCYRKSDNVIGLYDLVNNQFYTNSGTGTFSKGNDVTMAELKNAYIGEYLYKGPLRFTANTANSSIVLRKNGSPTSVTIEKSTDGTNWSTYTFGTWIDLSNIGDKVYFRNTSTTDTGFNINGANYYNFHGDGSFSCEGDITTLLNKNGTNTVSSTCFIDLFENCTGLTSAPLFPATNLAEYCYDMTFKGCTDLTTAPELPATTLAQSCYSGMFHGCTSLNTLPKLPATTLAQSCYSGMFNGCTSIKLSSTQTGEYQTAYRIPTTGTGTSGQYSLSNMFASTGGTFTGTPSINTTYYTSNTVV